jgi:O-antigen ligase
VTSGQPWTLPLRLVFALWVIVLCDPQIWLVAQGVSLAPQIVLALYGMLGAMVLAHAPPVSRWYPAFLFYLANACVMLPFAENTGVARNFVLKILFLYYILAVGSLTFIKSVEQARLVLLLFLLQFLWWLVQARFTDPNVGQMLWHPIAWHPSLGNTDAFAPLMVIGMGFAFYYGLATPKGRIRWLALAIGAMCVVGMVAAYTRGASVGAAMILLYVGLRSPNKSRTFWKLALATAVFFVATSIIYPQGQFWTRLASITAEGTETGTGADRWHLWQMGWHVFVRRPVFGAGAGNFGIFAFYHLPPSELIGRYQVHEAAIYGRALHNVYVQVLSEFGLVGALAFVGLLIDFWRRNRALRSAKLVTAWREAAPRGLELRAVSLALEAGMAAYLVTGLFYDQLYVHWFYSLLTINAVTHSVALRAAASQAPLPPLP